MTETEVKELDSDSTSPEIVDNLEYIITATPGKNVRVFHERGVSSNASSYWMVIMKQK